MTDSKKPPRPGPDGFLWQLWEYDDHIVLQRDCDAEGCDRGLLYAPVRNCSACRGSGYRTRSFPVGRESRPAFDA